MAYQPIENYGVIGDTQTVALVGANGSIDWFCFPRFDSPSVFGAILDHKNGGYFRISSQTDNIICKQLYWPETNVLITRFLSPDGVAEITDYMSIGSDATAAENRQVVRQVEMVRGTMPLRLECSPAFNYGRDVHQTRILREGVAFDGPGLSLALASSVPVTPDRNGVAAELRLHEGQKAVFVLREIPAGSGCGVTMSQQEGAADFVRTVRIGNAAYQQLQLDTCGELMDSVYLYNKYGSPISSEFWSDLRRLINWTSDNWTREDEGIWETRGGKRHFVYSKVMCWVALDRALRLADKRSFPADREKWLKVRDQIYEDVIANGWSNARQSFVQYYGSDCLDASNLIMPLVFFMAPSDPKMLKTLDAIYKPPDKGGLVANNLVYRYNLEEDADGLRSDEGTFNMCTFWLVEALTRAGRVDRTRLEEARLIFERMLGYANHLGLYAEETGPSGEALGNFPQAFTHLALISAAYNLDRALDGWK